MLAGHVSVLRQVTPRLPPRRGGVSSSLLCCLFHKGDTEPVALTVWICPSSRQLLLPRCDHVSAELRQPIGGQPLCSRRRPCLRGQEVVLGDRLVEIYVGRGIWRTARRSIEDLLQA